MLANLIAVPAEMKLNLHSIHAVPNKTNKTSTVDIGVEVNNSAQLVELMNKLKRVGSVYSVTRPITNNKGD